MSDTNSGSGLSQYKPYIPLKYATSQDVLIIHPDNHQPPSPANVENILPVPAPQLNNVLGGGLQKRRLEEEQQPMVEKRARQSIAPENFIAVSSPTNYTQSYNPMRPGTQSNPFKVESSPELQARNPPKVTYAPQPQPALPDLRHTGLFVQKPTPGMKKIKYYAVAHGRVPGIYTDWPSTLAQVSGFSGARHKKFDSEDQAWAFMNANRHYLERAHSRASAEAAPQHERVAQHMPPSSPPPPYTSAISTPPSRAHFQPKEDRAPPPPPRRISKQKNIVENARFGYVPEYDYVHDDEGDYAYEDEGDYAHDEYEDEDDYAPEPEPMLTAEQQRVVDLIVEGQKNVFYTGSAGCGKSTILKAFVQKLKAQGKNVKIVAPTNLAALNVGGQTTWAYAGWVPDSMKKPLDELKRSACGRLNWARFDQTDVLVIDEISMVENLQFERLNEIMKAALGNKNGGGPFGGVQVVVTGDFCQLSPVKPFVHCMGCGWELIHEEIDGEIQHRCENRKCRYDSWPDADKWAFRSKAWQECNFEHVNLTEIHRQTDRKFIAILQKIRRDGVIVDNHANILLNHPSETEDAIKIFALRRHVDRVNNENIAKLPSVARKYKCMDNFYWAEHQQDDSSLQKYTKLTEHGGHTLYYLKEHRYEGYSQLKEGMRVVLQANLSPDTGLVNGSQGFIVGFEEFDPRNLPRKLKRTESDEKGLKGEHAAYMEEEIKAFAHLNNCQPWPIVRFDNGREQTIYADCSYSEMGNEERRRGDSKDKKECSLLSRTQIPLMAGYAITVHKSQGMTLDRVIVDLRDAFESSQIYVALSRARSLNGLQVVSVPRRNLGGANQQVKEFFDTYLDHRSPYSASLPNLSSQEEHKK